jgi:hypothetical protein
LAQPGISVLTCRPKRAHEIKNIKVTEEARQAMAHTMQFNKVQHHQKKLPSPPPDNYFELRLSINTFCTLVWTLFGNKCNYYKELREVCETLNTQEAHIIRESFTPDICRCIMWAILSDSHSFFNMVLVEAQFRGREKFKWPTPLIYKMTDNVCFAQSIDHLFYPQEWLITNQSIPGNTGGRRRGRGERGRRGDQSQTTKR